MTPIKQNLNIKIELELKIYFKTTQIFKAIFIINRGRNRKVHYLIIQLIKVNINY
jgi:hypothetical protein